MHRLLDELVTKMVEKGIHYEDALREFDRRFIVEVVDKSNGNLCKAADVLGVHRQFMQRTMRVVGHLLGMTHDERGARRGMACIRRGRGVPGRHRRRERGV